MLPFFTLSAYSTKAGDYLILQSATSTDDVLKRQVKRSQDLTEKFLNNDRVNIGLIVDSLSPSVMHSLNQRKTKLIEVLKLLNKAKGSDIPMALKLAVQEFEKSNDPTRNRNLVIMLDQKLPKESYVTINQLKDEGVMVLFVVFGNKLDNKDIDDLKENGNVLIDSDDSDKDVDRTKDIVLAVEGRYPLFIVFIY